jgi:probable HAF family extracellular repeat protein
MRFTPSRKFHPAPSAFRGFSRFKEFRSRVTTRIMRAIRLALHGIICAALAGSLACSGAVLYTMKSTGGSVWKGKDINAKGEVVGWFDNAIYYNGDYATSIPALGGSGRYSYSELNAINNNRLMVGDSTTGVVDDNTGPRRAFVFNAVNGQIRELGSLGGPTGASNARGINDANLIVGESSTPSGTHAVRFETNGAITDLGTLGGEGSSAADINENGDIVGDAQNAEGSWRAFLLPAGGHMIDLGTLAGKESRAGRINNKGQVVGSSTTANGQQHAFLYSDGQMMDLGTLGTTSQALGINDDGVVVGTSVLESGLPEAFVRYPGGAMRDLGSIVRLAGDDMLLEASAINHSGFIVATLFHPVYHTGVSFTVILRPGALSGAVRDGQWQVTIGAPPGTALRLERSPDFKIWTSLLSVKIEDMEILHTEALEKEPRFFRMLVP